ncbi:LON peptidase substrate-binding domain-containing protein [Bordetella pertussis]|uniref:LON peptidase substrate-binding domain-containing protein n=1 Tax=Bordetella pertussis TaxID=520 RepID=UPI0005EA5A17|nr:LON peptidase substrate-binding domain-containing protein [Bordetella pertussis]CFO84804.1 Uncharacterized protein%2C similar to the N-terminal domain of Lon protease [Bordetella pertussis]
MAEIPLFPLSNALFPAGVLRLRVFEIRYLDMVRRCIADGSEFGVVVLEQGTEVRRPDGREVLARAGTMARIDHWEASMPALLELACTGTGRFRLHACTQGKYGLWTGQAEPVPDDAPLEVPPELARSASALGRLIARLQREGVPPHIMPMAAPFRLDDCGWVADRWAEMLSLPPADKARLLLLPPLDRLREIDAVLAADGHA